MGFAQNLHENYGQDRRSSGPSIFFQLRIRAEEGSEAGMESFEPGQPQVYGRHETGLFLIPFHQAPLIKYHPGKSQDAYLCAETFGDKECPACKAYDNYKTIYGDDKDNYPVKAQQEMFVAPFLSFRRQHQVHIHKGTWKVEPVYWFSLRCTNYIPEYKENYLRLRKLVEQGYRLEQYPYMIFQKDAPTVNNKKGKTEIFYRPVQYNPNVHQIICTHPIIQQYFIPVAGGGFNWRWDNNYFDLIQYLALLQFKAFSDPQTGQVYDYGGEYQRALQWYATVKDVWPPGAVKLEAQTQAPVPQYPGNPYQQPNPAFNPPSYQQQLGQQPQPLYQPPVPAHSQGLPQPTMYGGPVQGLSQPTMVGGYPQSYPPQQVPTTGQYLLTEEDIPF